MTLPKFVCATGISRRRTDPVPWAGVVLIALAALMLVEAVIGRLPVGTSPPTLDQAGAGVMS